MKRGEDRKGRGRREGKKGKRAKDCCEESEQVDMDAGEIP